MTTCECDTETYAGSGQYKTCSKEAKFEIKWYNFDAQFGACVCREHLLFLKRRFKMEGIAFEIEEFKQLIKPELVVFT